MFSEGLCGIFETDERVSSGNEVSLEGGAGGAGGSVEAVNIGYLLGPRGVSLGFVLAVFLPFR